MIGDGSMSAGMAYEAMNNAGALKKNMIVIINDNDMSIAPPVGAMSHYFARQVSSKSYRDLRKIGKGIAKTLGVETQARKAEEYLRGMAMGGTLFEELGFRYIGPIDGHDLEQLIAVLRNVRDADEGPVLIHAVTQKGKGYAPPNWPTTSITACRASTWSPESSKRPRRDRRASPPCLPTR